MSQVISSSNGAGINHVSYKEYWDVTRVAGTITPVVTLYWEDNSESSSEGSAISSPIPADLCVAEFYSAAWNTLGPGAISVSGITGTVSSSASPTFPSSPMQFTFGAPTLVNPLPIELLSFTGYSASNGNQLTWSTATEINNDYFDIERSSNGADFSKIGTLDGNGNSITTIVYNFTDATPLTGINYYRLKQVDYNGSFSYSNMISINGTFFENPIQVYPN
ncbi:MAG: hypothetical protein H0X46_08780, partial [Bacteroidetes bacterium]|nr:hypothetical protein [Bacteroidota bacterium]